VATATGTGAIEVGGAPAELAQVEAGAEGGVGAREHDGPDSGVVVEGDERPRQCGQDGGAQGVARRRPVDRDGPDGTRHLDEDDLAGHAHRGVPPAVIRVW
jgi:hypothetical protein